MLMTSVRNVVSIACVGLGLLSVAGCRDRADRERIGERVGERVTDETRPNERPGTATVTGANVVNNQSAIERIVAARCARESTCKNVGADKRFANSDACTQKLKADMKDDLNVNECPRGIDQKELNECLESIQKEDCNNPIDAISRLAACRTSDLCLATGAPNR
jgi:hypothetical protein